MLHQGSERSRDEQTAWSADARPGADSAHRLLRAGPPVRGVYICGHAPPRRCSPNADIATHVLTGVTTPLQRTRSLTSHREHGGVLIASEVGGTGLNLQYCSQLFEVGTPWEAACTPTPGTGGPAWIPAPAD